MRNRILKEGSARRWLLPTAGALGIVAIGALWFFHSRPTNSAHIRDVDMVGIFVAQTQEGKTTLALNKNHALRSVLVEPDGYTLKQKTGWWKLVRQPDGQQQLEYDGLIQRCPSGDGSVCISGQGDGGTKPGMGVPIDEVNGKITIYTDSGRFVKNKVLR